MSDDAGASSELNNENILSIPPLFLKFSLFHTPSDMRIATFSFYIFGLANSAALEATLR